MVGEFDPSLRINLLSVEWMTNSPPFGAIGRDFRDEKVIRHPRTTTGAMVFKTPSGVGFRVGESQGLHLNGLAARSIPERFQLAVRCLRMSIGRWSLGLAGSKPFFIGEMAKKFA
jgi:hypothetical protein